jgi:cytochrome c oxidase subunit 3
MAVPTTPEIDLVAQSTNRRGGPQPPGGGDGDPDNRRPGKPSESRYTTGIAIGIVSILMFFMALASAFIILRRGSGMWVALRLPRILWANTGVLLASSFTMESARRCLGSANLAAFRRLWLATTCLGFLFVAGQLFAWRELVLAGVYIASNQASSFFYIFTAAHAVHLLGGIGALLYVTLRNFEKSKVSLATAAELTSFYWHFMDGLWVFLLALLYLGK